MAKSANRTRETDKKKRKKWQKLHRMCTVTESARAESSAIVCKSSETKLRTNRRIARRAFPRRIRVCWYVNRRAKRDPANNDPNVGRSCLPTCCSRCTTPPPSIRSRICNGPSKLSETYLIIAQSRRTRKAKYFFLSFVSDNDNWLCVYFFCQKKLIILIIKVCRILIVSCWSQILDSRTNERERSIAHAYLLHNSAAFSQECLMLKNL